MITYREYQDAVDKNAFIFACVERHIASAEYKKYVDQSNYYHGKNSLIMDLQKFYTDIMGNKVNDTFSPNYKIPSNYLYRFVVQEVQHLLGNGIAFQNESTKDKLGTKRKPFDRQTVKLARLARTHGVSFGFFNKDHIDVFTPLEFIPLWDERSGALIAGIQWWRLDDSHPLYVTFYETDGYTKLYDDGEGPRIEEAKRPYKISLTSTKAEGEIARQGENYAGFPIVPMYSNDEGTSDLEPIKQQIDCYDLVFSGYANDIDDANFIYWTITNAGGMNDDDLVKFLARLRSIHAATTEDQEQVVPHQITKSTSSRDSFLAMSRAQLYESAMALDIYSIAGGAVTATQIKAAYEPLNSKVDDFEYQVTDWIYAILDLIGVEDTPTYQRSTIVNSSEEIQLALQAGQYLPADYITKRILTLMGDGDIAAQIIEEKEAEDAERMTQLLAAQQEQSRLTASQEMNANDGHGSQENG